MPFRELDEWFDSSLQLPIKGKTYRIESVDAETGIWCQRLFGVATKAARADQQGDDADTVDEEALKSLKLDDAEEIDLYRRLMGDTYGEMLDDKLPWEWIKHAGSTTLMWVVNGTEFAERFWNAGGSPEARRPEPQDRKAPARKAPRASTGGKKTQAAKATTPGPTSSSTGG